MDILIREKTSEIFGLHKQIFNPSTGVMGIYSPGSRDRLGRTGSYAQLRAGSKDADGNPISWRYLNADEQAYEKARLELEALKKAMNDEIDKTNDNSNFSDSNASKKDSSSAGKQCARCETNCTCIKNITVKPEGQSDLIWKQQGVMKELLLLDKGKGSKVTLKLASKQKGCSGKPKVADCPQLFISNSRLQKNIWEMHENITIDQEKTITLKYVMPHYKMREKYGYKKADFWDCMMAVFSGQLPSYLYGQRYKLIAIECLNTGTIAAKKEDKFERDLDNKKREIKKSSRSGFISEEIYSGDYSSDPNDPEDNNQFSMNIVLYPYYKAKISVTIGMGANVKEQDRNISKKQNITLKNSPAAQKAMKKRGLTVPSVSKSIKISGDLTETIVDTPYTLNVNGVEPGGSITISSEEQQYTKARKKESKKYAEPNYHSVPILSNLDKILVGVDKFGKQNPFGGVFRIEPKYPKITITGTAELAESKADTYLKRSVKIEANPIIGFKATADLTKALLGMIPGVGIILSAMVPDGIDDAYIDRQLKELLEAAEPARYNPRSWIGNPKGLFVGYLNFIVEGQLNAEIDIFTDEPPPHDWTGKVSGKLIPTLTLKGRCVGYAAVYSISGGFDASFTVAAKATLELELFKGQVEWVLYHEGITAKIEAKLIGNGEGGSNRGKTGGIDAKGKGSASFDLLKDDEGKPPEPFVLYPPLPKNQSDCRGVLIERSQKE